MLTTPKKRSEFAFLLFGFTNICHIGAMKRAFNGQVRHLWVLLFLWSLPWKVLSQKIDSAKIDAINLEAFNTINSSPQRALKLSEEALQLSLNSGYKKGEGKALLDLGLIAYEQGNYKQALDYYDKALAIRKSLNDERGVASVLNNKGIVHHSRGDYSRALDFFLESLKISQKINDKPVISALQTNIGSLYERSNDLEKALRYYSEGLEIKKEIQDMPGLAGLYNNIGIIYDRKKLFAEALENHTKALDIRTHIGDSMGVAASLTNIGEVYESMGKHSIALDYFKSALVLKKKLGDKLGTAIGFQNMGNLYRITGAYRLSMDYFQQALVLARQIGSRDQISKSLEALAFCNYKLGDYKKAYQFFAEYDRLRDSIFTAQNIEKLADLESRIKIQQKELQIELLSKDKKLQELQLKDKDAQVRHQRLFSIMMSIVTGLIVLFALFLYRSIRQQQKVNKLLAEKNDEIMAQRDDLEAKNRVIQIQKEEVEQKNKEVTDSLNYAQRIQKAILPTDSQIKPHLRDFFIFYVPRDIVSGDFYWFHPLEDGYIFCVGDCVGHGVPGAFMTVLGNSLLNEMVVEKGLHQPGAILQELNRKVLTNVNVRDTESQSGGEMDLVIIRVRKLEKKIEFAGAHNSLHHFNGQELITYKTDKHSIGSPGTESSTYNTYELSYQDGDMLYLSTDGFPDQFGGNLGKKYMTRNMKTLFEKIVKLDGPQQGAMVSEQFYSWKMSYYQTDDVLVAGIRL